MQMFFKITPAIALLMGAAYLVWRGMGKEAVSERNSESAGTNSGVDAAD